MNPDECEFARHTPKEKTSVALDLLRGLEDRTFNHFRGNLHAKQFREVFAEDELVRKKTYDEMRCEMPGQPKSTFLMVFSPDGSKVASTHGNHNIYVTDIKSGKNIRTLVGHPRTPWCVAFHPSSNQIVASGCLGGEVRIWDLSFSQGGSEVWTVGNQSVIASIAFHPNDRVLVIATYNELYFWDWSQPEPFVQVATSNPKEKIRYVAFDKLGHKLITGIANSPQTRWERVRAPVPVPRQAERSASPYRLRITPRLVNGPDPRAPLSARPDPPSAPPEPPRDSISSVPERERRITVSYRNLLREYEQLVQRYLKVYRPPTMIDRGTDPMETNSNNTNMTEPIPGPSTAEDPQPSTSRDFSSSLVVPSRILAMKKQLINSTQTTDTRKHKASENPQESRQKKRSKCDCSGSSEEVATADVEKSTTSTATNTTEVCSTSTATTSSCTTKQATASTSTDIPAVNVTNSPSSSSMGTSTSTPSTTTASTSHTETATQTQSPLKLLVISDKSAPAEVSTNDLPESKSPGLKIVCPPKRKQNKSKEASKKDPEAGPSSASDTVEEPAAEAGPSNLTSEDQAGPSDIRQVCTIIDNLLPIADDVRRRFLPIIKSLPAADRPKLIRRFENSRAHDRMRFRQMVPPFLKKPNRRPVLDTSSDASSSDDESTPSRASPPPAPPAPPPAPPVEPASEVAAPSSPPASIGGVRNFVIELEQLLMTVLQSEVEGTPAASTTLPTAPPPDASVPEPVYPSGSLAALARSSPVFMSANRAPALIRPLASGLGNFGIIRDLMELRQRAARQITGEEAGRAGTPEQRANALMQTRNYPRRRLSSHRISAFIPTRVNYSNRVPARYRRGTPRSLASARFTPAPSYPIDELINYSELPNAEDNLPHDSPQRDVTSPEPPAPATNNLTSIYSNIFHGLESTLTNVRNIQANNRPEERSDMLNSFAESLENIMNQSDTILRNLGGTMSMLPTNSPTAEPPTAEPSGREPRATFNDQSFYVRSAQELTTSELNRNLDDVLRGVIEADHNYPRNATSPAGGGEGGNMAPLMTSLHMTISYIQRQARLLRQQVDSIERIDRAMFEVEQLQVVRQLILEFIRIVRSIGGESRNAGVSSMRQMMAGTRISDSSPYESQPEESGGAPRSAQPQPSTSSGGASEQPAQARARPGRKTYPPSRLHRMQRHSRRSVFVNFFPRRYAGRPDRGAKHPVPSRNIPPRTPPETPSYSLLNSASLGIMLRRLEHLLTEQTRHITRAQESPTQPPPTRSHAATELGERILSIRLHDCVRRMNRIAGVRSPRSEAVVVTQDGAARFAARHFLSHIVLAMTKHLEEMGGANFPLGTRTQIHSVLVMSLLLSDLLLLQLVDSIPPPAGMNLDVERESLTTRIDQMCVQILQNRFSGHSHQLCRSLQQMRLTMRHAYRALGQTYNARRNAMLAGRADGPARYSMSPIGRLLLSRMNRRRQPASTDQTTSSSDTNPPSTSTDDQMAHWGGLRNLIMTYSSNANEDEEALDASSPTENAERPARVENASSNNSDDNDNDDEWVVQSNSARRANLYRTNNVYLAHNDEAVTAAAAASQPTAGGSARTWNVPSVHVNDQPMLEESPMQRRIMSHRQRLAAERVSDFRTFPQISVLRPRFLHPLYASVNPFDADLDDPQRETNYDCDMITTVTPNHRIQVWDISAGNIPIINNPLKNIIVSECKIHNDASVDIAKDGSILVTLLPSGGYLNVTNKLGIYSLKWDTLGQCLYTASFEQNAVSVALSPLSRHLVVGLASKRVSIVPSDRWTMARVFLIDQKNGPGDRLPVLRELHQNRDSRATNYKSVNCIRWLPTSGQGLIYATNTGQLVILT